MRSAFLKPCSLRYLATTPAHPAFALCTDPLQVSAGLVELVT
jgi:hypothetical protein